MKRIYRRIELDLDAMVDLYNEGHLSNANGIICYDTWTEEFVDISTCPADEVADCRQEVLQNRRYIALLGFSDLMGNFALQLIHHRVETLDSEGLILEEAPTDGKDGVSDSRIKDFALEVMADSILAALQTCVRFIHVPYEIVIIDGHPDDIICFYDPTEAEWFDVDEDGFVDR